MQNFIENYLPYIFSALVILANLVSMVYTRKTGKNIDKGVSQIMKYRLPSYREKTAATAQEFSPLVQTFRLDKSTGELVPNDVIDIDKLVLSNIDSALEKMLERFMPVDISDQIKGEIDYTERDLADVGAALVTLAEWREQFKLDPMTPISEVLTHVEQYRDDLLKKQKAAAEKQTTPPAPSVDELTAMRAKIDELIAQKDGGKNA